MTTTDVIRFPARPADGTFETVGVKGAAPPSQSGHITLALLAGVEAELAARAAA